VDYNACWVTGLTNGALYFNTNGTAIPNVLAIPSVGSPAPPSLDFSSGGTFTLSAFVNGTLPQTNGGAIFCKGTGGGGEQFAVDLNGAAANFRFYVRGTNNGVFINPVATTAVPVNGTWQHVAAVCDCVNGIMNIYVNGQLAGASVAPLTLLSNSHEISIGNRQSGATPYNLPFTGGIDEARMYNRALTSADIQALYATGGLYPPSFITQPVGGTVYVGPDSPEIVIPERPSNPPGGLGARTIDAPNADGKTPSLSQCAGGRQCTGGPGHDQHIHQENISRRDHAYPAALRVCPA
jgi:hypothetical protein